jgi:hypothetical protein
LEQLSIRLYVNEEDKMLLEKLLKLPQESILAAHLENLKKVREKASALVAAYQHGEDADVDVCITIS